MHTLWVAAVLFVALILELWAGAAGVPVPALALAAFYLAMGFRGARVLLPALAAGLALDLALGRAVPATAGLIVPGAMLLATFWRREGICRDLYAQAAPGAVLGLVQAALLLLLISLPSEPLTPHLLLHGAWLALRCGLAAALLLPLACGALDALARRLSLPRYRDAQQHPLDLHAA